jgi:hypothetical protein
MVSSSYKIKQMKNLILYSLLTVFLNLNFAQTKMEDNPIKLWEQIEALKGEGRVADAEKQNEQNLAKFKTKNDVPNYLKAVLYKINFTKDKEEDATKKSIDFLNGEYTTATFPVKNVLAYFMANMYSSYFSNEKWEISQRTELANPDFKTEIDTWTAKMFTQKVRELYLLSLENETDLQKISVAGFDSIIIKGQSRDLRPTLFDFLAFEAFEYYKREHEYDLAATEQFKIYNKAYLTDLESFLKLKPDVKYANSPRYTAILLLQKILIFRKSQSQVAPLIDADVIRLKYFYDLSTFADKDILLQKQYELLEAKYANDPVIGEVGFEIATLYQKKGNKYNVNADTTGRFILKKAIDKCQQVIVKFPNSRGAEMCVGIVNSIEHKDFNLQSERIIVPSKTFKLFANYRNLNKVQFKFYKTSPTALKAIANEYEKLRKKEYLPESDLVLAYPKFMTAKVDQEKTFNLPQTNDYQMQMVELPLAGLKAGSYVIYVFDGQDAKPLFAEVVQVSNLAYMQTNSVDKQEIYVLNNETGATLAGAKVEIWEEKYNYSSGNRTEKLLSSAVSDASGKVALPFANKNDYSQIFINIYHGNDALVNNLEYWNNNLTYRRTKYDIEKPKAQTYFQIITDRAIYRPGQTVHYKVIAYSVLDKKAKVLAALSSSIQLKNVNGEKVSENSFVTGDYGSASGSFVLPASGLTGAFSLTINGNGYYGNQGILVEEYKRPKFEVGYEPVKEAFKLGAVAKVTLKATSFAGVPVDGAKVSFKVSRGVSYPYLFAMRCYWLPRVAPTQITVGEVTTDAQGHAVISFLAEPEEGVYGQESAIFNYEITADVTDINGETQSGTTNIRLSKAPVEIVSAIPAQVDLEQKSPLWVTVQNLNGQPQKVQLSYSLQKLSEPQKFFKSRYWEKPSVFVMSKAEHDAQFADEVYNSENLITEYPMQANLLTQELSDSNIMIPNEVLQKSGAGAYVLMVTAIVDGQKISEKIYFSVKSVNAKNYTQLAQLLVNKTQFVPNDELHVTVKTAEKGLNIFYQYAYNEATANIWKKKTAQFENKYKLANPGYVGLSITYVWKNRIYQESVFPYVENTDQRLNIKFETFRDKLQPGQKETWKMKIVGNGSKKAVNPELMALLYDASLDKFASHSVMFNYLNYYQNLEIAQVAEIAARSFNYGYSFEKNTPSARPKTYDEFKYSDILSVDRYRNRRAMMSNEIGGVVYRSASAPMEKELAKVSKKADSIDKEVAADSFASKSNLETKEAEPTAKKEDAEPQVRRNFQETAFFYPNLTTDSIGSVFVNFTIPEALTKWRMLGVAHTKDMKLGFIENSLITQKELMVTPNVPRFLREGDRMTLQAKINNLLDQPISASVKIDFFDPLTGKNINELMAKGLVLSKTVPVAAKQSQMAEWTIGVPEGISAVTYRVTASANQHSDAEENTVVVLTNKMLVTETMPLNVNAGKTKTFKLEKLANNTSTTLRSHKLTFEYTSNPAWYALQALPYLMEYPYECAEQTFSRYYANDISAFVMNSSPKIKAVFDRWSKLEPSALLSNLEKNQELKNIAIEETPWLNDAKDESENKRRMALLFDLNKMGNEKQAALKKLKDMQLASGAFEWFKGMYPDRYITQHILAGLGYLSKIKGSLTEDEQEIVDKAIGYLDAQINKDYEEVLKMVREKHTTLEEQHISYTQIHYLYARSFFKTSIPSGFTKAFDYYKAQGEKYWLKNNRYAQGMLALALFRDGKVATAQKIVTSIKQYALESDEMGMYWKESYGYYWHEAPIETHALMIEVAAEVAQDAVMVDKLKLWLLKQKQTTRWSTTKATATACYALLMKGSNWLAESSMPVVELGTQKLVIDEKNTEAGTGYFKTSFSGTEIKKEMADIKIQNTSSVVNWGAIYWQYFENIDKVTAANTSLVIEKNLFLHQKTAEGDKLVATDKNTLQIGDLVTVRLVIKTDRNLEYVHLKDGRSAGFEPVNVLSQYKYSNGLGYYESTRDASTNFFINYLNKGTYVFEYDLRVSHKGDFSNGVSSIQCMYAPEFAAHSSGSRVIVGQK